MSQTHTFLRSYVDGNGRKVQLLVTVDLDKAEAEALRLANKIRGRRTSAKAAGGTLAVAILLDEAAS